MDASAASWEVGAQCRRLSWLLHASVVEAKHAQLVLAFKAGFNPNQPRVPAGNPDGGRWTGSGGGGGSGLTQVAQNIPPEEELRERESLEPETPGQAARLALAVARREEAVRKVHELDPNWQPTPSFTETTEGKILATESEAQEAEARLEELAQVGIGPGSFAGEFIPARGPDRNFTAAERREINRIGGETGCHTCGTRESGLTSGNFVPDHQPPNALNVSRGSQRLYPQCAACSRYQGYAVGRQRGFGK